MGQKPKAPAAIVGHVDTLDVSLSQHVRAPLEAIHLRSTPCTFLTYTCIALLHVANWCKGTHAAYKGSLAILVDHQPSQRFLLLFWKFIELQLLRQLLVHLMVGVTVTTNQLPRVARNMPTVTLQSLRTVFAHYGNVEAENSVAATECQPAWWHSRAGPVPCNLSTL